MQQTAPRQIPHRIETGLTGKVTVVYHCPKCQAVQRLRLVDAGHDELCSECGALHVVPGEAHKAARASKHIADSLAADARATAAKAAREKRKADDIAFFKYLWNIRWSSLWILRAMCVLIGILASYLWLMYLWTHLQIKAYSHDTVVNGVKLITGERLEHYQGLFVTRAWYFLTGWYITGFFATLLIGYSIAAAIERSGRAKSQPQ